MQIAVIGDSHARIWNEVKKLLPNDVTVHIKSISSASAQGLQNVCSRTQSIRQYKTFLGTLNLAQIDYIIVQLGNVDMDFVLWHRLNVRNITVQQQIDYSLSCMMKFFDDELKSLNRKIIFIGAYLPPIRDDKIREVLGHEDAFANLEAEICMFKDVSLKAIGNHKERTQITILYNKHLKEEVEKRGYLYFDTTEETFDKNTGLVDDKFVDKENLLEHHLNKNIVPIVANKFMKLADIKQTTYKYSE